MFFNKIIDSYKKSYHISSKDLTDASESNRINAIVVSMILLISDIIDFSILFLVHHAHLVEQLHSIIYLCFYTLLNLYIYIHSRRAKQGSYIQKTIPAYLLLFVGLSASILNFYFLESPHNGFITYYLVGFLFIIVFSTSPIMFLLELIPPLAILAPGVYKAFGLLTLIDIFVVTAIMFCVSLYKRIYEKKLITLLKKQKTNLEARTFGNFTLMYQNKRIHFSRSKSEELMGYLIYKKGTSVKTKELISVLWGDEAEYSRYGSNFRNLILDIKHTLNELEIQDFFITEYNNYRINPMILKCDYYDFLEGDTTAEKSFTGEFMNQYSWAEETAAFLEQKLQRERR